MQKLWYHYAQLDEIRKASSLVEASNVEKKFDEIKLRKYWINMQICIYCFLVCANTSLLGSIGLFGGWVFQS